MDQYSFWAVAIMMLVMSLNVLARIRFERHEPAQPSSPPRNSRYDILEAEVARLQAQNAQLAVKAAKTEYR